MYTSYYICPTENATAVQKEEFMKEIEMMKRVSSGKCAYIVNTIGCSTLQEPIALVIEYVPYGDLLGYLRNSRRNMQVYNLSPRVDTISVLLHMYFP